LKEFGIELPLFPAIAPGLLPPIADVGPDDAKSQQAWREATADWVRIQAELGLDVISDGGQYRSEDMVCGAGGIGGLKPGGLVRLSGNRYWRRPVIAGKVRWLGPLSVDWWKFAQKHTDRPVKGILPGPYSLAVMSLDSHYLDRRKAALALAREIRREAEALIKAGCRILEIDEPAFGTRPEELPLVIEATQALVSRLPAYFVLHACYADYSLVYPAMLDLPVHNISLEMAQSEMEFLDLLAATPFGKDISLGVIDVQAPKPDSSEAVRARIRKALESLEPEQVWIVPDCGMYGLPAEEAKARLKAMAEAAASFRRDA
jgi:5-methyltetrahydropteroyltriglutamate--homocysteine methyltransferase